MRILLVGHGKMGQLVDQFAGQYGCEIAGVIDPNSPRHGGGPDDDRWRCGVGGDVEVEFEQDVAGAGVFKVAGDAGFVGPGGERSCEKN